MKLQRGGKEYLKTILLLERQNGSVRSLDVARALNVTKPSVSKAMKHLREGGYLSMEGDKRICLTKAGRQIAEQALEKHRILTNCLLSMGVDPVVAERDASQMEHGISPESLERMQRFVAGKERERM